MVTINPDTGNLIQVNLRKKVKQMKITEEQNKLLLKHDIDYKTLSYIEELLDILDDKILEHLVNQEYLNDEGIKLQNMYDEIYNNN